MQCKGWVFITEHSGMQGQFLTQKNLKNFSPPPASKVGASDFAPQERITLMDIK